MSISSKKRNSGRIAFLVQIAMLSAIIIVMGFTPLGFLKLGVVEITFLAIPVAIGAVTMGWKGGLILGSVFGIVSFIQCFGMSQLGVFLLSLDPVRTFILCVVPRALCGFLPGLICDLIAKKGSRGGIGSCITASVLCPVFNTIFFVLFFVLFFGNDGQVLDVFGASSLMGIITSLITFNALIEAAVCTAVGAALSKALIHVLGRTRARAAE